MPKPSLRRGLMFFCMIIGTLGKVVVNRDKRSTLGYKPVDTVTLSHFCGARSNLARLPYGVTATLAASL